MKKNYHTYKCRYRKLTDYNFQYMMNDGKHYFMGSAVGKQVGNTFVTKKNTYVPQNYSVSPYFLKTFNELIKENKSLQNWNVDTSNLFQVHRSRCCVDAVFKSLKKYTEWTETYQKPELDKFAYDLALRYVKDRMPKSLCKVELKEILQNPGVYLSDINTSAGYPYVLTNINKKKEVISHPTFQHNNQILREIMHYTEDHTFYRQFVGPCIAYQKSAIIKPGKEDKVRLIWGYPVDLSTIEMQYVYPIIQECKNLEKKGTGITSYTLTAYSGEYSNMIMTFHDAPTKVTDYSSFDTSISKELIQDAFKIIKDMFPESENNVLSCIEDYFINTPLIIPDTGTLFIKNHGIPSGSTFTNLVGSMVNAIMMAYAHFSERQRIITMRVMGDDNLTVTKSYCLGTVLPRLKQFNVEINASKCYEGPLHHAKYLGRNFDFTPGNNYGWRKDGVSTILSLAIPAHKDDETRFYQRLYCLYLDNPVPFMRKYVEKYEKEVSTALTKDFDSEQNRFIVFNMFSGDFNAAKMFLRRKSKDPPSLLRKPATMWW